MKAEEVFRKAKERLKSGKFGSSKRYSSRYTFLYDYRLDISSDSISFFDRESGPQKEGFDAVTAFINIRGSEHLEEFKEIYELAKKTHEKHEKQSLLSKIRDL